MEKILDAPIREWLKDKPLQPSPVPNKPLEAENTKDYQNIEPLQNTEFQTTTKDSPNFLVEGKYNLSAAKNACKWLAFNRLTPCSRRCKDVYCYQHKFQFKRGKLPATPCKKCEIGVRNEFNLCVGCGYKSTYDKAKIRKEREERKKREDEMTWKVLSTTATPLISLP